MGAGEPLLSLARRGTSVCEGPEGVRTAPLRFGAEAVVNRHERIVYNLASTRGKEFSVGHRLTREGRSSGRAEAPWPQTPVLATND